MNYSRRKEIILITSFSVVFGIIYLWFVSIGTWTQLSMTSTYYYRMLADGFLAASPALLIEPDPRLAQIENPYPAENRENIPTLMDAAYFNGKYYLYFGPAPALILAGFMVIFKRAVSDGYFSFFSAWMIFTFSALLITSVWRNHFQHIPMWLVVLSLIITGTMYPVMWAVNSARIYEAATLTCGAFIVAGLYLAFDSLDGKSSKRFNLIIAGILWGLAIGSRLLSVIIVAVLCCAILVRLLWRENKIKFSKPVIINILALLIPIGLTLVIMGWYNYIRFDSPFESGVRYSLIGVKGVSSFSQEGKIFNLHYFLPNLENYLFNSLEIIQTFPFVKLMQANGSLYNAIMLTDEGYYREGIAGLLISMPFIVFSGVFIWFSIGHFNNKNRTSHLHSFNSGISRPIDLISSIGSIGVAGLLGFVVLLNFFAVTTRYLLDFIVLLNIVTITGMWIFYTELGNSLIPRRILSFLFLLLAIYSTGLSFLLAITGELDRFQINNPGLFEKLAKFFS